MNDMSKIIDKLDNIAVSLDDMDAGRTIPHSQSHIQALVIRSNGDDIVLSDDIIIGWKYYGDGCASYVLLATWCGSFCLDGSLDNLMTDKGISVVLHNTETDLYLFSGLSGLCETWGTRGDLVEYAIAANKRKVA